MFYKHLFNEPKFVRTYLFYLLLIFFVSFFLVRSFFTPLVEGIKTVSSYFVVNTLMVINYCGKPIQNYISERNDLNQLKKKFDELSIAYEQIQQDYIALSSERRYERESAEIIAFKNRYLNNKGIVASIILRSFADHGHFMYVNVGSKQGVEENMVALFNNCILGRVSAVYPWHSTITLITDKSCKVAAYCAKTNAKGIHEGTNDFITQLAYVDHLALVQEGDTIISSGQGLIFPQGFGLGRIAAIAQEGLVQKVVVERIVDMRTIDYCVLISRYECE